MYRYRSPVGVVHAWTMLVIGSSSCRPRLSSVVSSTAELPFWSVVSCYIQRYRTACTPDTAVGAISREIYTERTEITPDVYTIQLEVDVRRWSCVLRPVQCSFSAV